VLATENFLFVHVPKTGGEFIANAMRRTCEVCEVGKHVPFRATPEEFRELPAICFVRNPWDWYVSWWHWARAHEGEERDFREFVRSSFDQPKDYYTRVFEGMVHDPGSGRRKRLMHQARFEFLREEFVAFLDHHQISNDALREAILTNPPGNTSKDRKHYRDYYDNDTKTLVGASLMARLYAVYEF
jgi:hypothetical protein